MALIAWQMIRHTKQACFSLSPIYVDVLLRIQGEWEERNRPDRSGSGPRIQSVSVPFFWAGSAYFFPTESESLDSLVLRIPQS